MLPLSGEAMWLSGSVMKNKWEIKDPGFAPILGLCRAQARAQPSLGLF
jgi:hypothetical protein